MKKVFCENCKYYNWYFIAFDIELDCAAPENLIKKCDWKSDWVEGLRKPNVINKNNNCKWYKSKLWVKIKSILKKRGIR